MQFIYKGKIYDAMKVNGRWKAYSKEPVTIEEAKEVLKALEATEKNYEYYLILGGTLWRINEKEKTYETYVSGKDSWEDMSWLGDKLSHEVECAKHLGERYSEQDALELCKRFHQEYEERNKKEKTK